MNHCSMAAPEKTAANAAADFCSVRTMGNCSLFYGNDELVHKMAPDKLDELCKIIDSANKWQQLGSHMGYTAEELEVIYPRPVILYSTIVTWFLRSP